MRRKWQYWEYKTLLQFLKSQFSAYIQYKILTCRETTRILTKYKLIVSVHPVLCVAYLCVCVFTQYMSCVSPNP